MGDDVCRAKAISTEAREPGCDNKPSDIAVDIAYSCIAFGEDRDESPSGSVVASNIAKNDVGSSTAIVSLFLK